jgi:hypothetical protein
MQYVIPAASVRDAFDALLRQFPEQQEQIRTIHRSLCDAIYAAEEPLESTTAWQRMIRQRDAEAQ